MDEILTSTHGSSRSNYFITALILTLLLSACGGEGGDDTINPVVTAPANIIVAADSVTGTPASSATIVVFLAGAFAIDNIDGPVSVTNNAPSTFPADLTTTINFSASDAAGNIGTATATVTVDAFDVSADAISPVVTAPANIQVASDSVSGTPASNTAIVTFLADTSAMDNIDGSVTVTNNAPTTFPADSVTIVTFSASDSAGNVGTATATITVDSFVGDTSWSGTKQLGALGYSTNGTSVATDAIGNIYVAGFTTGSLDGNVTANYTRQDFFVTKYDSFGNRQYTRQLGSARGDVYGTSVATDVNDNVYVAGFSEGGLDGNVQAGSRDLFVTKYDSAGIKQYTRQLGVEGATFSYAQGVATDTNGNVYVAGYTNGNLDGEATTGLGLFIVKYDSTGVKQYTRLLGLQGSETYGRAVATDANGNVYVAGYIEIRLDGYIEDVVDTLTGLDGNVQTGIVDAFVTKYDSSGTKQYTRQFSMADVDRTTLTYAHGVATDINGNVYVTGMVARGLDSNVRPGAADAFVTKYDNTGVKIFTRQIGVAGADSFGDYNSFVATDENGNAYVAGTTVRGLNDNGLTDFFVTKYDNLGNKQ